MSNPKSVIVIELTVLLATTIVAFAPNQFAPVPLVINGTFMYVPFA